MSYYNNSFNFYPLPESDSYSLSLLEYIEWNESFVKTKTLIQRYLYALFLLLGTVGNIPCAWYLAKYSQTAWSVCFYLVLSMLFGLIELYIYCGNLWFLAVTGISLTWKINILSNAICKVYNFITNVLIYFISWITVATAVETMVTVTSPQRVYKMCTVERARSIVLLILVLVVSLNLHYFWTIGLSLPENNPDVEQPMCHNNYQPQLSDDVSLILPLSEFFLDNFLPCILVAIFVGISIAKWKKHKESITFELQKYILDVDMLCELKLPTLVMLTTFSVMKALQCVEHIMRFVQSQKEDPNDIFYLMKEIQCIQLANFTMTYFYISCKPFLFIILSRQLRSDISQRISKLFCGRNIYKSHITPESTMTSTRLKSTDKQPNGDMPSTFKCTNV